MNKSPLAIVLDKLNKGTLGDLAFNRALKKLNKVELQALFDMVTAGEVGTPRERLQAKATQEQTERFMAKFRKLSIQAQSEVWLKLESGANPDEII
jgi:hypothetical protein